MKSLKKVTFYGISFEMMNKIAKLFEYGTEYWFWCRLYYNGSNTAGDLTIEFSGARDHSKEIPELLLKVAEALNN